MRGQMGLDQIQPGKLRSVAQRVPGIVGGWGGAVLRCQPAELGQVQPGLSQEAHPLSGSLHEDGVGVGASPTHPSIRLAPPPALVPANAAVDLHHVAFPQRELAHVPGGKVVSGHGRADDTGCEHCWGDGRHRATWRGPARAGGPSGPAGSLSRCLALCPRWRQSGPQPQGPSLLCRSTNCGTWSI